MRSSEPYGLLLRVFLQRSIQDAVHESCTAWCSFVRLMQPSYLMRYHEVSRYLEFWCTQDRSYSTEGSWGFGASIQDWNTS